MQIWIQNPAVALNCQVTLSKPEARLRPPFPISETELTIFTLQ